MKFVIQKVSEASVHVEGECIGRINRGFLVFVGIGREDTKETADQYIKKMVNLRIFYGCRRKDKPVSGRCGRGGASDIPVHTVRQLQKRQPAQLLWRRRTSDGGSAL